MSKRIINSVLRHPAYKNASSTPKAVPSSEYGLPTTLFKSLAEVFSLRNQVRVAAWQAELAKWVGQVRLNQITVGHAELELTLVKLAKNSVRVDLESKREDLAHKQLLTEIAREHGIPPHTVGEWLMKKLDVEVREALQKSEIEKKAAMDQLDLKKSNEEYAQGFDWTKKTAAEIERQRKKREREDERKAKGVHGTKPATGQAPERPSTPADSKPEH